MPDMTTGAPSQRNFKKAATVSHAPCSACAYHGGAMGLTALLRPTSQCEQSEKSRKCRRLCQDQKWTFSAIQSCISFIFPAGACTRLEAEFVMQTAGRCLNGLRRRRLVWQPVRRAPEACSILARPHAQDLWQASPTALPLSAANTHVAIPMFLSS